MSAERLLEQLNGFCGSERSRGKEESKVPQKPRVGHPAVASFERLAKNMPKR